MYEYRRVYEEQGLGVLIYVDASGVKVFILLGMIVCALLFFYYL